MGMSPGRAAPGACLDDARRDACLHSLGDHYATGRISVEELDSRIQRALAAETEEELASVMAGLASDPADDAEVLVDAPRTGLGRFGTQVVRLSEALLGFLARRGPTARRRRTNEERPVESAAAPSRSVPAAGILRSGDEASAAGDEPRSEPEAEAAGEVAAGPSGRGPVPRRVRLNGGVIPGQRVGD